MKVVNERTNADWSELAKAMLMLGRRFLEQQNFQDALACCNKAQSLLGNLQVITDADWPKFAKCKELQGKTLFLQKNLEGSLVCYQRAEMFLANISMKTDLNWRDMGLYQRNQCKILFLQNNFDDALVFCRRAEATYNNILNKEDVDWRSIGEVQHFKGEILSCNLARIEEGFSCFLKYVMSLNNIKDKSSADIEDLSSCITLLQMFIRTQLTSKKFKSAVDFFVLLIEEVYLSEEIENKLKQSFNPDNNKVICFSATSDKNVSTYASLILYDRTVAGIFDLVVRMLQTVNNDNAPPLWDEIYTLLTGNLYVAHNAVIKSLEIFCRVLEFAVDHSIDNDCKHFINPDILKKCATKDSTNDIKELIERLRIRIATNLTLSAHVVASAVERVNIVSVEKAELITLVEQLRIERDRLLNEVRNQNNDTTVTKEPPTPSPPL